MAKVSLVDTTKESIQNYAMCGYKNVKHEGYQKKTTWCQSYYKDGLRYKILESDKDGAVGGLEYMPGSHTWRAIAAKDYMVIQCMYIMAKDYKAKGYGQLMLDACIRDAKKEKMKGVAVVARKSSWMVSRELFMKNGFEVADQAKPDFELLVLTFSKNETLPSFNDNQAQLQTRYKKGLYMLTSDQCPFVQKALTEMGEVCQKELKLKMNVVELKSAKEAQNSPCPFGTFCIIYNGKVIADHPVSKTGFLNKIRKELNIKK